MLNALNFIILLKIRTMISNFQFIPYLNILQNFVENVRKTKKNPLSWADYALCYAIPSLVFLLHGYCYESNRIAASVI